MSSSPPRFDGAHRLTLRGHPQTHQPPQPREQPPPPPLATLLLPHLAASPSLLLPPLSPATSPLPNTPAKLLLLQLSLVCENAAQTSRRASEAGGHLRPEDVVSLRESLTAAGFFFGQLSASTSIHASTSAAATGRSVSPALAPSPSPSPSATRAHHGDGGVNCSTFCPSVSTAFSPSSTSASSPGINIAPMLSLGLSSIARYSSPVLSCPSPSSSPSPMSSPRPSTSAPSSSAAASVGHGPQHNHNNNSNQPNESVISLHQQLNHSLSLIGASGLLDLGTPSSSPTLSQASPDMRGLGLGPFHAPRVCVECGRESSIQWRSGPMGSSTLCNACGMRYMRKRKKEEKKRALLAAAQGDHSGKQQNNNSSNKRRSNKRAKITHPRATAGQEQHQVHQQQEANSDTGEEKNQHGTKSASSSSSEGEGEGEEDAGAGASHRASVNFLLN